MGNIFNQDFREFITALNNHDVEYILVGDYSVILHGYSRTTGVMDIWVNRTETNYKKLVAGFHEFGMPVFDMSLYNFLQNDKLDVFTFGRAPVSIDIMNRLKGLEFESAYALSNMISVEGISIRLINYNHLIEAKRASGRPKDLDDLENLIDK